ncbi:MAG TPA: TetR family transcriptional regulator [Pseudonocardia sp.]|jgi:AcrR family transcriptional regulator
MPAKQKRVQNRARTKLALATAAVRLFRERGYAQTTVEDIAEAAGSSPSTFFRYFGTKEDVLFLNIREIMDDFREFVAEPIPGLKRWDQIKTGMHLSVRKVAEPDPEITDVSLMSWLSEPAISARYSQFAREMEGIIAAALAQDRGTHPDRDLGAQLAARSATAVYMSTFHLHVHTGRDLSDLLAEAFELLESGVRPHRDDYAR